MKMSCAPSKQQGSRRPVSAFSREPGKPKTYLQQAIKERSQDWWWLLQQEAIIFVCGEDSRMAPDVRQAFVEVFQQHTGTPATDGNAWLTGLVTEPPLSRGSLGFLESYSSSFSFSFSFCSPFLPGSLTIESRNTCFRSLTR